MNAERIAELLAPFLGQERELDESFLLRISIYIDLLTKWNRQVNLTAIRNQEEIVTRHFGESLFAARHLFACASPTSVSLARGAAEGKISAQRDFRLADLGSGAGFPGIPIKLWADQIELTLVEAHGKKATFLREVVRALNLKEVRVENARAEVLPAGGFDLVTIRAVEKFSLVLLVAAQLLRPNGRLALLISAAQLEAVHESLPQCLWSQAIPVPLSGSRVLLMSKAKSDST